MFKKIQMKKGEYWYGGAVNDGYLFPLCEEDSYSIDLRFNDTYNQVNPFYVSSQGRYIWLERAGKITFAKCVIEIEAEEIELDESQTTLKEAQLAAARKHFPSNGLYPNEIAFTAPQICTWIHMQTNQNEKGVLEYAKGYLEAGGKAGVLIIDDTWQQAYGDWEFHEERFPTPKRMIDTLHEWGFKVVLWVVPYVHADTKAFATLKDRDVFIRKPDGELLPVTWWQGTGYGLDFYRQEAREWFLEQTERLKREYGVDGFKLDGGDGQFYGKEYPYSNEQNTLWTKAAGVDGVSDSLVELRAAYKNGGYHFISRLADKAHIWGVTRVESENKHDNSYLMYGLSTLVPNLLTQGLTGYYYGCPDMVGGGLNTTFEDGKLDGELLLRSLQCASAMPMMQFSYAIWSDEKNDLKKHFEKAMRVRALLSEYIVELAKRASKTGEPIARYMEYEYPHEGLEKTNEQFLIGERFLVAPVLKKGQTEKKVRFPKNTRWKEVFTGEEYSEGETSVKVSLDSILIFEKI